MLSRLEREPRGTTLSCKSNFGYKSISPLSFTTVSGDGPFDSLVLMKVVSADVSSETAY